MAEIFHKGIDVSYANGKIDWTKMKNNIDFAIIRCGFGGDFRSQDDAQFFNNIKGCSENGIPFGVYLYSYATTEQKAESEAAHVLRLLDGIIPSMPVFYDLEESRISATGKTRILGIAKTFCNIVENAGYVCGIYANKNWFENYLTDSWYDSKVKWIAQYNDTVTYKGRYDIWQYSQTGKIDGFSGKFDLNYCYLSLVCGDTDNDGKVTASDARKVLRVSAGIDKLTGQALLNADVDKDGKITADDARSVLRKAAGLD